MCLSGVIALDAITKLSCTSNSDRCKRLNVDDFMSSVSFYFCFYDRPKTSTQFLVLEVIARRGAGWSSFFKTEGLNYT